MWLITNRGFYSAVQDKNDPNVIVIRARTDRHLEAIMDLLPEGTVISTDEGRYTDYPCRVRVSAAEFIALAGKLAAEVDYTNFKDSVDDRARDGSAAERKHAAYDHSVYMSVWGVLRRLTSTREEKQQQRQGSGRGAKRGRGRGGNVRTSGWPMDPHPSQGRQDTLMSFDPWPSDDPLRPRGVQLDEPRGVEGEPGICPHHGPQPGYVYRSGYGPDGYAQLLCSVPSSDGGACNEPLA